MSDKTKAQTKAQLFEMLAQAVRNTQPQPMGTIRAEPARDERSASKPKTRPASKRAAKTKKAGASATRKQPRR
jgi:hypothetical protein